jgi:cytosine/uracil/thiamine/allantoin permease
MYEGLKGLAMYALVVLAVGVYLGVAGLLQYEVGRLTAFAWFFGVPGLALLIARHRFNGRVYGTKTNGGA